MLIALHILKILLYLFKEFTLREILTLLVVLLLISQLLFICWLKRTQKNKELISFKQNKKNRSNYLLLSPEQTIFPGQLSEDSSYIHTHTHTSINIKLNFLFITFFSIKLNVF